MPVKLSCFQMDILLSGIFGDEVLKVGRPMAGAVISTNTIGLIENSFNPGTFLKNFQDSQIRKLFKTSRIEISDQLEARLNVISKRYGIYKTSGQRYFAFRFLLNLRKYFGNEVNSYNDFVHCFSPFIDYDFLKEFARTKYMVSKYNFTKTSLKQNAQSSWLYYRLTKLNYPALIIYPSSRGFSMNDTRTLKGISKVLYTRTLRKVLRNKKPDGFNTRNTDQIFHTMLIENNLVNKNPVFITDRFDCAKDDFYSQLYWIAAISKNYIH